MTRKAGDVGRRATMKDVAKRAGVSLQTVSNFVNGRLDQMGDETRERVAWAMESLDYRTNMAAASLRSQRSHALSVLVLDEQSAFLADPLTHRLIAGVGDVAREFGYGMLIELGQGSEGPGSLLESLKDGRADGAVIQLYGSRSIRKRCAVEASNLGVPVVIIDETALPAGTLSVRASQEAAAAELTRLLVAQGRDRIAFIGDAVTWAGVEQRLGGYRSALRRLGIGFDKSLVRLEAHDHAVDGERLAEEILKAPAPPSAIMCSSDLIAAGALRAARGMGLRVPRDIAIAGFDDSPFAQSLDPALTTVSIPAYDMGRAAADLLIRAIKGNAIDQPHVVLPTTLMRRDSA
jgi:DNA-binding LacI/PurR family transcriptional regulator